MKFKDKPNKKPGYYLKIVWTNWNTGDFVEEDEKFFSKEESFKAYFELYTKIEKLYYNGISEDEAVESIINLLNNNNKLKNELISAGFSVLREMEVNKYQIMDKLNLHDCHGDWANNNKDIDKLEGTFVDEQGKEFIVTL